MTTLDFIPFQETMLVKVQVKDDDVIQSFFVDFFRLRVDVAAVNSTYTEAPGQVFTMESRTG